MTADGNGEIGNITEKKERGLKWEV